MFCEAKGLDEKSRDQLSTLVALALRIGGEGKEELLEACKAILRDARSSGTIGTTPAWIIDLLNSIVSKVECRA